MKLVHLFILFLLLSQLIFSKLKKRKKKTKIHTRVRFYSKKIRYSLKKYKSLTKLNKELRNRIFEQFTKIWGDVKKFSYFKQMLVGVLVYKLTTTIPTDMKDENIQKIITCTKDQLGDKLSLEEMTEKFQEIKNLSNKLADDLKTSFQLLYEKLSDVYNLFSSWTKIKQVITDTGAQVDSFLDALKDILVESANILFTFLEPLSACKDSLEKDEKKDDKDSSWGNFMNIANQVYSYAKSINSQLQTFTPGGILLKLAANPEVLLDLFFLCKEFVIKVIVDQKFQNVEWERIGEVFSGIAAFLLNSKAI
jgi:hypothetical protein